MVWLQSKPIIHFKVLGQAEAGISTAIGHLISEIGTDKSIREECDIKQQAFGTVCDVYSWILEKFKSDREQDLSSDYLQLESKKYLFSLVDAPGHKNFVKNMCTGNPQADCALLFVSACPEEFENGISENGIINQHIQIAWNAHVWQLIVLINKMDDVTVNFSQERFQKIHRVLSDTFSRIGYKPQHVTFIPVSGLHGDNLTSKSNNMVWYSGPTVIEAMDSLIEHEDYDSKPLRLPLQDVYKIGGIGTVPVGRVEYGILKSGMTVIFAPSNLTTEVKSVETYHELVVGATHGTNCGFNVKNLTVKDLKRGMVCGDPSNNPPTEVEAFLAQVVVVSAEDEIKPGFTSAISVHTAHVQCKMDMILATIDRRTGKKLTRYPRSLKKDDCAIIRMIPLKPLCLERYCDFPALGIFAARGLGQNKLIGVVTHVMKKGELNSNCADNMKGKYGRASGSYGLQNTRTIHLIAC